MDSPLFLPHVFKPETVGGVQLEQPADEVGGVLVKAGHLRELALEDTTEDIGGGHLVEGGLAGQPTR